MVWFCDCGLALNVVVCLGCFAGVLALLVGLTVLIVACVSVFRGFGLLCSWLFYCLCVAVVLGLGFTLFGLFWDRLVVYVCFVGAIWVGRKLLACLLLLLFSCVWLLLCCGLRWWVWLLLM